MLDDTVERPRALFCDSGPSADMAVPAILAADLDDQTIAYAIAIRTPFEDLRQAAAQLAGLLVLAAAGSRGDIRDHPMLTLARRSHDQAIDAIRMTTAPWRGRHHHQHLTRAALWIGRALSRVQSCLGRQEPLDVDGTLPLLRRGWKELQWTASALPGFEIIAFDQACCAHHAHRNATNAGTSTASNRRRGTPHG